MRSTFFGRSWIGIGARLGLLAALAVFMGFGLLSLQGGDAEAAGVPTLTLKDRSNNPYTPYTWTDGRVTVEYKCGTYKTMKTFTATGFHTASFAAAGGCDPATVYGIQIDREKPYIEAVAVIPCWFFFGSGICKDSFFSSDSSDSENSDTSAGSARVNAANIAIQEESCGMFWDILDLMECFFPEQAASTGYVYEERVGVVFRCIDAFSGPKRQPYHDHLFEIIDVPNQGNLISVFSSNEFTFGGGCMDKAGNTPALKGRIKIAVQYQLP